MNLASIDLNLLVALDALLSEAHVGRAARKIGLSQPATSHALKRLRELVDDPLLVRVGSRMELTPRAIRIRESLAETLQRVQNLLVVDSFDPTKSHRRFSIMVQDHVAHLIIIPLLRRLQREAPDVQLNVLPWQYPMALKPERYRSIDILISCSESEISGFKKEPLFTDAEVTVVGKKYLSAANLKKLKSFLNSRHVAVVGRGRTEDPVDIWLREEGLMRRIALRVPGYLQALQAVAQTDLVAIVPKRLAKSMSGSLSLTLLPPPIAPGEYCEYLCYPHHTAEDPASIWMRKLILEIGKNI